MNQKLLLSIITSGCALTLLNSCENPTTLPNSEAKYSSPVLTSSSAGSLASSSSLSSGQISTSSSAGNLSSSNNALSSQVATSSATLGSSATATSSATSISSATLSSSAQINASMNLTINTTSFGPPCQNSTANVIAVYVTDANGVFKRTLKFNAATRVQYLAQWKTAAAVTTVSNADGYAGATRNSYSPYTMTWNLLDKSGALIPDGNYILKMEGACDNIKDQQTAQVPFSINSGKLSPGTKTGSASFSIGTWTLQ